MRNFLNSLNAAWTVGQDAKRPPVRAGKVSRQELSRLFADELGYGAAAPGRPGATC